MITVTIPHRVVSESNTRGHWSAKAKRTSKTRDIVGLTLRALGPTITPKLRVTLTRVAPRELDDDNIRGALKAARDSVAAWLRVDDATKLVSWEYAQRKGEPGEYAVEVGFEAVAS